MASPPIVSVILALLIFVNFYWAEGADFVRVSLTDSNPLAVCNDGSPAMYFYRAGTGSGANIWTIYLEGGGWCYDMNSCKSRNTSQHHFMTSKLLPLVLSDSTKSPDVNHGGINSGNSAANPHFYNANQVYLWYCSSDVHAGNHVADTTTWGFHFRGKVIVRTLIEDLATRYKSSFLAAQNILLLGYSAGALGTMNNADFVGGIVKNIVPTANFRAYMDSGWFFDTPLYASDGANRDVPIGMYPNLNMSYDQSCMDVYKASGEQWRCHIPVYTYPHITVPLIIAGYQFDTPFLDAHPPFNATSEEYYVFMRKTFLMDTQPLKTLFSPNCDCHGVVAFDTRWDKITVQGTTASELVWKWINSNPPAAIRAVDTCVKAGCNPTCSCIYN